MEHPMTDPIAEHEPWQRLPGESARAHTAFLAYRDMGVDRSVLGLGKSLAKSRQVLDRYCQEWSWRARVAAWDAHLQRAADTSKTERVRKMIADHGNSAVVLRNLALRGMQPRPLLDRDGIPLRDRAGEIIMRPPTLRDLGGAATALSTAIKNERLAAGLPTDIQQHHVALHRTIEEMNGMMAEVIEVIESQLCPECRVKIADRMDEIGRQRAAIAAEIV